MNREGVGHGCTGPTVSLLHDDFESLRDLISGGIKCVNKRLESFGGLDDESDDVIEKDSEKRNQDL